MASQVLKKRRLVNPGRRRRMTAKQIKYFGTPRQKAGLKNRSRRRTGSKAFSISRKVRRARKRGSSAQASYYASRESTRARKHYAQNRGHRKRRRNQSGIVSQAERAAERAIQSVEHAAEDAISAVTSQVNRGRRRNVGEILTVIPANPGRRRGRKMATRNRRRRARVSNPVHRRRYRRRRMNTSHRRRTRRNRNPKVVVRYRNRYAHRNRNSHRRRNPNFLTGDAGAVVGVLGGAAVTKILAGFLPANFRTGWMGYLSTGLVAVVTGQVAGKVLKNSRLGNMVTVGGLLVVGLQIAQDLIPGFQSPFGVTTSGTAGMGLITSSNFYVPQVNLPGSMATFVTPAGIPAPVVVPATAMHGIGATGTSTMNSALRRVGRLR